MKKVDLNEVQKDYKVEVTAYVEFDDSEIEELYEEWEEEGGRDCHGSFDEFVAEKAYDRGQDLIFRSGEADVEIY
jgi:hypothetical protein